MASLIEKVCLECECVFKTLSHKRGMQKRFCSIFCARSNTGKRNKGRKHSFEINKKKGLPGKLNPFFNRKHTDETKEKIGAANSGRRFSASINSKKGSLGATNPAWKGGISLQEYGKAFNTSLKLKIKTRENFTCFLCPRKINLIVHHVDYNKKNNSMANLVTLCRICHGKTGINRNYWKELFLERML